MSCLTCIHNAAGHCLYWEDDLRNKGIPVNVRIPMNTTQYCREWQGEETICIGSQFVRVRQSLVGSIQSDPMPTPEEACEHLQERLREIEEASA